MFEKEAKKHKEEFITIYISVGGGLKAADMIGIQKEQSYKEGAEFGYNKANEWHQQGTDNIYDLIAKDWTISYFICIMKDKSLVTATGSCDEAYNGEVSVNLVFDYDDEKYSLDDIVWWKELRLPKE